MPILVVDNGDGTGTLAGGGGGGGGGGGNVNLNQVGGATFALGQSTKAGSLPVTLASDQGALAISATALPLPTGAATAALQPALNGDGGALAHITNFPATQPVSGTVAVSNFPGTQMVSGTVTVVDSVPLSVVVSNFPSTQPVSGTVSVGNFPTTQPVSGSVSVSNFPTTQPVSGSVAVSNFPATQPVSTAYTSQQVGTWSYYASAGTTINVATGQRVIGIAVHATTAGSFSIGGGASIPVPANSSIEIQPVGNLMGPVAITFSGIDSAFVEVVQ